MRTFFFLPFYNSSHHIFFCSELKCWIFKDSLTDWHANNCEHLQLWSIALINDTVGQIEMIDDGHMGDSTLVLMKYFNNAEKTPLCITVRGFQVKCKKGLAHLNLFMMDVANLPCTIISRTLLRLASSGTEKKHWRFF